MTGFVLDCSIAVSWILEDEASAATDALLERVRVEKALVPSLWHLEFGNVLLQAERRGRISAGEVTARIERWLSCPSSPTGKPRPEHGGRS